MKKENLNEITLDTIKEGIFEAYKPGITSIAPLGQSGPTIILHDEAKPGESGRVSQVSLRNYCGDVELLITNKNGGFLFYGRYDCRMGLEFIAQEYFRIFENCKHLIKEESKSRPNFSNIKISDNASKTIGFQMMNMVGLGFYQ